MTSGKIEITFKPSEVAPGQVVEGEVRSVTLAYATEAGVVWREDDGSTKFTSWDLIEEMRAEE